MTKLIDLTHRKEATDLLVDCANIAVWYGFPFASHVIIEWMKHRSDSAAPVMWIDALRSMRFEDFETAKTILRDLLVANPQDSHAKALLLHILMESGDSAAEAEVAKYGADEAFDPSAQALLNHSRLRQAKPRQVSQTPAYGAVAI